LNRKKHSNEPIQNNVTNNISIHTLKDEKISKGLLLVVIPVIITGIFTIIAAFISKPETPIVKDETIEETTRKYPSSGEETTSNGPPVPVPPPLPKPEEIIIKVPNSPFGLSPGSAFGQNVRIELEQINDNYQAVGRITIDGYETRDFTRDRHSSPVEIGDYRIEVIETGNDYAKFSVARIK